MEQSDKKQCAKCKEIKYLVDFCKDKKQKDGINTWCKACSKAYIAVYYKNNIAKMKSNADKWKKLNPDKRKAIIAKYRKFNSKKCTESTMKWRKKNPVKCRAIKAKRRASELNATPKWLSKPYLKDIELFYKNAQEKTFSSGIVHEVDHIIPLQGKLVSGLHVPWNLQILSIEENRRKGNRLI